MTIQTRPAEATRAEPIPGAPAIAARLAEIIAHLVKIIPAILLRDPRRVMLIFPLIQRIQRLRDRFARLMDRIAAGRLFRPHRGAPRQAPPRDPLPRKRAWLLAALRHDGAMAGKWIGELLDRPDTRALLEAHPEAATILRPLCRMLDVETTALPCPAPSPKAPKAPKAPKPIPPPESPMRPPSQRHPGLRQKNA